MKTTKSKNNGILCGELKVGMIVVSYCQMNLILSVKKEKIFWLNQKGKICHWFNKVEDIFDSGQGQEFLVIENDT